MREQAALEAIPCGCAAATAAAYLAPIERVAQDVHSAAAQAAKAYEAFKAALRSAGIPPARYLRLAGDGSGTAIDLLVIARAAVATHHAATAKLVAAAARAARDEHHATVAGLVRLTREQLADGPPAVTETLTGTLQAAPCAPPMCDHADLPGTTWESARWALAA
ncbi:MAG: hypothetical protein LBJ02_10975 [Bifidobacteriaceae bacterium]|nr:hypothetical protein [Bifidobacteriaceae bacterium]